MTGRTNENAINPWLVGILAAAALAVIAAAPAQASMATIEIADSQTESTMDWPMQAVRFDVEGTKTSSAHLIVGYDRVEEVTRKPAEAPIPSAAVSGSVMLALGAIVRVLRKKQSI